MPRWVRYISCDMGAISRARELRAKKKLRARAAPKTAISKSLSAEDAGAGSLRVAFGFAGGGPDDPFLQVLAR